MIRDQDCITDKFSSSHLKKIPVFVQKAAPSARQMPGSIQIKLISSLKVPFFEVLWVLSRHLKRLTTIANILIGCPFLGVFS